ncbi:MAG: helix-turn-helix domain-containing protein [Dysosmobacter sp.]
MFSAAAKSLTQEAMAEQLRISSRAYSDLERGKYAASAPTLLFLFLCWRRMRSVC